MVKCDAFGSDTRAESCSVIGSRTKTCTYLREGRDTNTRPGGACMVSGGIDREHSVGEILSRRSLKPPGMQHQLATLPRQQHRPADSSRGR
eukprot:2400543-Amphidinium_carterae.1